MFVQISFNDFQRKFNFKVIRLMDNFQMKTKLTATAMKVNVVEQVILF